MRLTLFKFLQSFFNASSVHGTSLTWKHSNTNEYNQFYCLISGGLSDLHVVAFISSDIKFVTKHTMPPSFCIKLLAKSIFIHLMTLPKLWFACQIFSDFCSFLRQLAVERPLSPLDVALSVTSAAADTNRCRAQCYPKVNRFKKFSNFAEKWNFLHSFLWVSQFVWL